MIKSFRDVQAEAIFKGKRPGKGFPASLIRVTRRKLVMLAEVRVLDDLKAPPANRLEALKGNRAGQHSIRINDQFLVCFVWNGSNAEDVEVVDYHS